MISYLEGTLDEKTPTRVVIDVHGVGYEVLIPLATFDRLPSRGHDCRILIYDYIREDARTLFGFMEDADRQMFVQLLAVNGIGPKIALSALSGLSVREIKQSVAENDVKRLSSVSGIGKKMAERIVVELRHKLSDADVLELKSATPGDEVGDLRVRDTVLALIALGYKQADAMKLAKDAISRAGTADSVEDLVKRALVKT